MSHPYHGLNELREMFLKFFETKGHLRLPSFSLVPQNDKSILLINAGMTPMKPWFKGEEEPPCRRVCTCQKCIRTGDIDNVGKTARHGTYFEMLGNFSFGDYFKHEAIAWSWEFLTSPEWVGLEADRLYPSVYESDDEAFAIWRDEIGIPEVRIFRFGKEDNFWEHGSGPCGPCSEIYYDRGPEYGCGKPGCTVGCDCDRYIEIWNNVFSQFDNDGHNNYTELKQKNIDTGMGLERLACVCQNVASLFDVDTVMNITHKVSELTGAHYGESYKRDVSLRVITDHIRSATFMICDGILPSNEGRGYVLRRLLRRAARHGRMLGIDRPFLTELVDTVIHENKAGYPELEEHADYIKKVIGTEEERFYKTIDQGLNILNGLIDNITKAALSGKEKILSGIDAFKLNDTFGFPLDLTREIAAEAGITVDEENFQVEMKKQKEKARQDRLSRDISGWSADLFGELNAEPTVFTGYDVLEDKGTVLALSDGEELLEAVSTDDGAKEGVLVVLDRTPFYAESGGQVADTGTIVTASGARLEVKAVKKTPKGYFVHTCTLTEGTAIVGETATASVSKGRRRAIARNHTSAHLLQKALREVLGSHVHQAGSYEDDERVRFDFTHFSAVTPEELALVEHIVNQKIFEALDVTVQNMPLAEAKKMGAMALFGEKYGEIVRVVDINGWSTEFCGGTHVSNTAQLGCFKILSESSVAAGVRRIEGTTGFGVLRLLDERTEMLHKVAGSLKVNNLKDLPLRAEGMAAEVKSLTKELEQVKAEVAASKIDGLFENAAEVNGIHIVTAYLSGTAPEALRGMCEKIRDKAPNVVSALVGSTDGKISLVVCCGKGAQDAGLKAGVLVKQIAAIAGGNGGGKPDLAMAGLKDATKIDEALNAVPGIVAGILQA